MGNAHIESRKLRCQRCETVSDFVRSKETWAEGPDDLECVGCGRDGPFVPVETPTFDVTLHVEDDEDTDHPSHYNNEYLLYLMESGAEDWASVTIVENDQEDANLVVITGDGDERAATIGHVSEHGYKKWGTIYEDEVEALVGALEGA